MNKKSIEFLRKRDYEFVKTLGRGACGETVVLFDPIIDEQFVCKKYLPAFEGLKEELYEGFVRETKLLHLLNHLNVVRVFNYYLYPTNHAGYIIMEYIRGSNIHEYLKNNPERASDVFLQTINGFAHLERHGILHRDIRPLNILVTDDGIAKIIDFGFGKKIASSEDFDKSISLNWWCDLPDEFSEQIYDFRTEVYFVGMLFAGAIRESGIDEFGYKNLLSRMCMPNADNRIESFSKIKQEILSGKFQGIAFSDEEMSTYRRFAQSISAATSKIESDARYVDDIDDVGRRMEDAYRSMMLEEYAPSNKFIVRCFISGGYYFSTSNIIEISNFRQFLELFRSCSREKKEIVLGNLHTRLDAVARYAAEPPDFDDDIPF